MFETESTTVITNTFTALSLSCTFAAAAAATYASGSSLLLACMLGGQTQSELFLSWDLAGFAFELK